MKLQDRIARSELPRRFLGAVLAVFVPGAGHITLGYTTLGWIVAGITLAVGGAALACALAVQPTLFVAFGALLVLSLVASAVSIFALPPGPRIKDGLRALWPVLVLFVVFRGAGYLVPHVMTTYTIANDTMLPMIGTGDMLFATTTPRAIELGDVVVLEDPRHAGQLLVERVIAKEGQRVETSKTGVTIDGTPLPETNAQPTTIREMGTDGKIADHTYRKGEEALADRAYPVLFGDATITSSSTTVPANELFVLGDNRDGGIDSRTFGAIDRSAVKATALFVFAAGATDGRGRVWQRLWSPRH